jgi:hypothetical protein
MSSTPAAPPWSVDHWHLNPSVESFVLTPASSVPATGDQPAWLPMVHSMTCHPTIVSRIELTPAEAQTVLDAERIIERAGAVRPDAST